MADTAMTDMHHGTEPVLTSPTPAVDDKEAAKAAAKKADARREVPVVTAQDKTDAIVWKDTIGIFYDENNLQEAVYNLEKAGFAKDCVSILADEATLRKQLGKKFRNVRELAYDPSTPRRRPVLSRELNFTQGLAIFLGAAVGMTATTVSAVMSAHVMSDFQMMMTMLAGSVGGTLIGLGQALIMNRSHTKNIREQIRRGGLLLWVAVNGEEQERTARAILKNSAARDVNVYEFAAATADG